MIKHWYGSDLEIYGVSRLGNCDVVHASEYLAGRQKRICKAGEGLWRWLVLLGKQRGEEKLYRLVHSLLVYNRETKGCLEPKAGLTELQQGETMGRLEFPVPE